MEALGEARRIGRHVDLLTNKAFSWKPLGGSGRFTIILGQDAGRGTMRFGPARRVGSSELLGSERVPVRLMDSP
jgi:hypothetical protein